jgi:hypothetical protein
MSEFDKDIVDTINIFHEYTKFRDAYRLLSSVNKVELVILKLPSNKFETKSLINPLH